MALLRATIRFYRTKPKPLMRQKTLVKSEAVHVEFERLYSKLKLMNFIVAARARRKAKDGKKTIIAEEFHKRFLQCCKTLYRQQKGIVCTLFNITVLQSSDEIHNQEEQIIDLYPADLLQIPVENDHNNHNNTDNRNNHNTNHKRKRQFQNTTNSGIRNEMNRNRITKDRRRRSNNRERLIMEHKQRRETALVPHQQPVSIIKEDFGRLSINSPPPSPVIKPVSIIKQEDFDRLSINSPPPRMNINQHTPPASVVNINNHFQQIQQIPIKREEDFQAGPSTIVHHQQQHHFQSTNNNYHPQPWPSTIVHHQQHHHFQPVPQIPPPNHHHHGHHYYQPVPQIPPPNHHHFQPVPQIPPNHHHFQPVPQIPPPNHHHFQFQQIPPVHPPAVAEDAQVSQLQRENEELRRQRDTCQALLQQMEYDSNINNTYTHQWRFM